MPPKTISPAARNGGLSARFASKLLGLLVGSIKDGDQVADRLARDGSVDTVPGFVLRGGSGGSAEGWLYALRFRRLRRGLAVRP